jgi:hypothetical protein
MYFVSSVLLMRMNVPAQYRYYSHLEIYYFRVKLESSCFRISVIITQVLGDLQFNFYHRWFDVIFLVSAVSSIIFMYLAHQQKEIAERHAIY